VGKDRLGEFYHLSLMLLPLYAERAAELVFFGPDSVTTSSAVGMSDAFEIAYYCVRNSQLHPRFSAMPPVHLYMYFGQDKGQPDPLTEYMDLEIK
jgi:cell division protease FtsH